VEAALLATKDTGGEVFALACVASSCNDTFNDNALLIINGCEKNCASKVLLAMNVKPRWTLDISTLGIIKTNIGICSDDDLSLVVDAIEAACTDVEAQIPGCTNGCGCR
jgi:uncharacterized metal-binding protein